MKQTLSLALSCLWLCAALSVSGQTAQVEPAAKTFWSKFQSAVAKGDKEAVAAMTRFPLTMPYGVPSVKTKAQFLQRYAKIFDAETKRCFAAAKPERENNKSKRFNIACGEAMLYEFDFVNGEYKFIAVDNVNE
jgi:hypothetical protein